MTRSSISTAGGVGRRDRPISLPVFTSLPPCTAARRNQMGMLKGANGVADRCYVCEKTAADTYAWASCDAAGGGGGGGATGPTGPQGAAGAQGPQGAAGSNGSQGPQGAAGSQGPQGVKGDTGTAGAAGSQGPQGVKGDKGDTGAAGSQGPQGTAGAQGPQGVKGDTGAAGPQGAAGSNGSQGPQGTAGAAGAQGPTGPQGTAGTAGSQGPQGAQGVKGDTGAAGPQGAAGSNGSQGPQGTAGAAGAQGPTGPQGTAGTAGSQGPQGAQGVKGDTGAAGPQGAAGSNGSQGPQGPQGSAGPQGPTGAASTVTGPTGPQGVAGTTGPTGQHGGTWRFFYTFDSATSDPTGDITAGTLRLNNATQIDADNIWVTETDALGADVDGPFTVVGSGGIGNTGTWRIVHRDDPGKFIAGRVVGKLTSIWNFRGLDLAWPATYSSSSSPFANGDPVVLHVLPPGAQGATGPTGPAGPQGTSAGDVTGPSSSVDGEIALFNGTTGKAVKRASLTGLVKAASGVASAAVAGTDYCPATSGAGLLKGNGSGGTTGLTPYTATATTSVSNGSSGSVTKTCAAGEIMIGGGCDWNGTTEAALYFHANAPNATSGTPTGWSCGCRNAQGSGSKTCRAYVLCLS